MCWRSITEEFAGQSVSAGEENPVLASTGHLSLQSFASDGVLTC